MTPDLYDFLSLYFVLPHSRIPMFIPLSAVHESQLAATGDMCGVDTHFYCQGGSQVVDPPCQVLPSQVASKQPAQKPPSGSADFCHIHFVQNECVSPFDC